MQRLKVKFEETLAALWPEFNYHRRYYTSSPKTLAKEFKAFRFGASPPATNPPSSKTSSQSALSSSQFNASSQKTKMTGSLRVPNAGGDLDPPKPQPEV